MTTFFQPHESLCPCKRPECDAPKDFHRLTRLYLDRVRAMYGQPLVVTSANRCATHNASPEVKGEAVSEHVWPDGCLGVDLLVSGSRDRFRLIDAIRQSGITRYGVRYPKHVHVGVGDMIDSAMFPPLVAW